MSNRIEGVYAITPDCDSVEELREKVGAAIEGGVRLVQYRNKISSAQRRLEQALMLSDLTGGAGALLIVNDDPELAARCGARGVHLGRDDPQVVQARSRLGPSATIGVSCYADLARAAAAQSQGASYVAFGSFYPSASKPGASPAPLSLLTQARARLTLPIVAIGGIGHDNVRAVLEAGASAVAVINGVFGARDIVAAARELVQIAAQAKQRSPVQPS
jgi:thiamine-phosphate pyrophosphorylase